MDKLTRRRFLGVSAAAVGATAFGSLPAALRAAMTTPPAGNSIADVKHVVILMQENRSFDHYFGTLRGVRGFADPSALLQQSGDSIFAQPGSSGSVLPFHLDTTTTSAQCVGDLAHDWDSTHAAWNAGGGNHWVPAKGEMTMGYYTRADIPYHFALADAFTICDAYHCSIMSATGPNRTYLWSGMIDPNGHFEGPIINGGDESGLTWTTYAERLQAASVSWKVYQVAEDNYGDNGLQYFTQFSSALPGDPLYDFGVASVPSSGAESTVGDIAAAIKSDVLNGRLPKVSWIVGPALASEHPSYPSALGADFINQVLEALTADPAVWASTVLLINYDENDGYFDHATPITPPDGTPDEFVEGLPIGLGPRVPMFIVSPWSRGGYVCSEVFDHTSVIRFLEVLTGVMEPNISAWRRTVCGDLTSAFDFNSSMIDVPTLPDTATLAALAVKECTTLPAPTVPADQSLPLQEPGTRPQRPLPYQANATSSVDIPNGFLRINMSNTGTQSVHHSVYANNYRSDGPWQYDVPSINGAVQDNFDVQTYGDGRYDLSVYGPNGFLRRLIGDINAVGGSLEVASSYDLVTPGHNTLVLTLTNSGSASALFTVTPNAYVSDAPRTYTVAAGESISDRWDVGQAANSWYDFSATVDIDPLFSRRFAGHIEGAAALAQGDVIFGNGFEAAN
ncbi:MAG: phospholipase C, phosphocholine-specific [Dokdonella sp.]